MQVYRISIKDAIVYNINISNNAEFKDFARFNGDDWDNIEKFSKYLYTAKPWQLKDYIFRIF